MRSSAESWIGDVGGIVFAEDDDMLDSVEWVWSLLVALSHLELEGGEKNKKYSLLIGF